MVSPVTPIAATVPLPSAKIRLSVESTVTTRPSPPFRFPCWSEGDRRKSRVELVGALRLGGDAIESRPELRLELRDTAQHRISTEHEDSGVPQVVAAGEIGARRLEVRLLPKAMHHT